MLLGEKTAKTESPNWVEIARINYYCLLQQEEVISDWSSRLSVVRAPNSENKVVEVQSWQKL